MKKMDVFKAVEAIRIELSKLIGIDTVSVSFRATPAYKVIEVTVHYLKPDGSTYNFSVHLYEYSSNFSLEQIIADCKSEIARINPKSVTEFSVTL